MALQLRLAKLPTNDQVLAVLLRKSENVVNDIYKIRRGSYVLTSLSSIRTAVGNWA